MKDEVAMTWPFARCDVASDYGNVPAIGTEMLRVRVSEMPALCEMRPPVCLVTRGTDADGSLRARSVECAVA